ncbi:alpha/beta fold hydrolase [Streptomyces zagrosensis]|uniref:Pimeloyl-ACP methyl ester carboxylesterase n=1 Tax=Streptomyces zagrosensis TaxID=1042984 RepID=A0A7W9V0Y2_9ACTN|nr:alpha/beta hydrolase [Streptomyces zagrosensis]MBB5938342.1 pimeloyl-ACP methyl ester carboxylesterase [Streptomyces zagrosensis]
MNRLSHATQGRYAPPAPARELTVTSADGARIYTEQHGLDDAPAVVLAHGWTCSIAFWAPVIRELRDDYRVIVYDQRGHGRSAAPQYGGYTTDTLADDLVAVLDQTLGTAPDGTKEQAVLVGHSMGGMTIMAAASRPELRERTAAVLLCSTSAGQLLAEALVLPTPRGRVRARLHTAVLGSAAPLGPVTPLARRVLKYVTMGRGATVEMTDACARIVHACPRQGRAKWGHMMGDMDLDRYVGELTAPTAIIVGTADRLTPKVHARKIDAALPNSLGLTELPGIGHMTPMEVPDTVVGAIRGLATTYLTPSALATATAPAQTAPAQTAAVPDAATATAKEQTA